MTTRQGLVVRKLADTSAGVERYNHATRETYLENPDGDQWPFAGLEIDGEPPKEVRMPMNWVSRGVQEGWISLDNERAVKCPGGTKDNPWSKTHTFFHADAITLRTVDGSVRYRVVAQPGKYVLSPRRFVTEEDVESGLECEVCWFFDADLVEG